MPKSPSKKTAPRKDLHDGRSLWCDSRGTTVRTRAERSDLDKDIVVVGGGISGSLIALVLAEAGYDVAVLDRRAPGQGSTVASTAMIQFEIDTPLTKLAEKIGWKKASRAYLRSARAVKDLKALIKAHEIDAKWSDREALYLAGNEMGRRGLEKEAAVRQKIDLPSTFLSAEELREQFSIDRTGAILSDGSAELDPAATAAGCLRAAQALGASVISPCNVKQVRSSDEGVTLTTKSGHIVTCRKSIFATGYEVIAGVPRGAFDIVSSWAIATKRIAPASFWPSRCLIWEAADPYLYMRATADDRVLIGGEDSGLVDPERRERAIATKSQALLKKAKRLLHRDDLEIDYAWAGAFADSPTGLPYFQELPDMPGVFAVLGCGGNGITFSMIAAQTAKAWVSGRADADADLFVGL